MQVDIGLGHPGGVDSGRTGAGDADRAPGPLPAAHGQDHGLRLDGQVSGRGSRVDLLLRGQCQHRGIGLIGDAKSLYLPHKAGGILRAAQGLAEAGEAEAVVDALP